MINVEFWNRLYTCDCGIHFAKIRLYEELQFFLEEGAGLHVYVCATFKQPHFGFTVTIPLKGNHIV